MTLCCVVFEIFNVEQYRDLEIQVKGQSQSLKVVPSDVLDNTAEPQGQGQDQGLTTLIMGQSKSLRMSPFDRAHTTSY